MKNAQNGECRLTPCVQEAIEWAQQEAGYEVDLKLLMSHLRYAYLVRIRRLAAWRLRVEHRKPFEWIAAALHRADHATILHHVKLENKARGLPSNYPLDEWRREAQERLDNHIEEINAEVIACGDFDRVATVWRVSTERLRAAVYAHRVHSVQNPKLHSADDRHTDRIAPEPVGASM